MRKGFVYLARRQDGLYKVGYSSDVERRVNSLAAFYKQKIILEHTWRHNKARDIEYYVHKILAPYRVKSLMGREIYDATKEKIIAVIENSIKESKKFPFRKETSKQNNRISIEFSEETVAWLKKEAEKTDTSMSWVIRMSVKWQMEHQNA